MDETTAPRLTPTMERLIASIRREMAGPGDPAATARAVAGHLGEALSDPELLAQEHCEPAADRYRQHILHAEPDGSFSVVGLVWLPGQETPVHDHVSWCVPGVFRGREEETRYRLVGAARKDAAGSAGDAWLEVSGTGINLAGDVVALTPPGDIHRVRNPGPEKAISVHVYGADIRRLGSSIRRRYELPIRSGA